MKRKHETTTIKKDGKVVGYFGVLHPVPKSKKKKKSHS